MSLIELALAAMLEVERPVATPLETRTAAAERWATVIAPSLARVAEDPPVEWHWRDDTGILQLIRGEVTIADHESHFGWLVHSGKKRGGGAVCLTQVDPVTARRFDIDPESLVGTSAEATERCFRASVLLLAKSRDWAERHCSNASHWFAPSVAAYGSGAGCVPTGRWMDGVKARVATYERTGLRHPLPFNMRVLLSEVTDAS